MGKGKGLTRSSSKLKKEKKRMKEKKVEKIVEKERRKAQAEAAATGESAVNGVAQSGDVLAAKPADSLESSQASVPPSPSKGNGKGKGKGKESASSFGMRVPAFAGPAMPHMILHYTRPASYHGSIDDDLLLRRTQSLHEVKSRPEPVPVITLTSCEDPEENVTAKECPQTPPSIHSADFSLKTKRQSYAHRSMLHRLTSVSDRAKSVIETVTTTTANAARNTLKVPPVWEWKGTCFRKGQYGKNIDALPLLHVEEWDGERFPYARDWKTGARYRYYSRTAPVGPGFVAVGKREERVRRNRETRVIWGCLSEVAEDLAKESDENRLDEDQESGEAGSSKFLQRSRSFTEWEFLDRMDEAQESGETGSIKYLQRSRSFTEKEFADIPLEDPVAASREDSEDDLVRLLGRFGS